MNLLTGTRVGPYEIVGWLGAGGMGEVYRARDARLGREVAIKLIAEPLAMDQRRVQRFEQEARAAGQLNHPNILAVHDVGTDAGAPYIVAELLEGQSLRRCLQPGALPVRKAVDYARQAAEGLAAAHERGIVHRDLKPDNLFITTDGRVKILDFGIAKLTQPDGDTVGPAGAGTETADGVVMGTAGYMSPEQLRGELVDPRSDIFSLGAILCEMLTGRPVFTRDNAADTVAAILTEDAATLPRTIPQSLERLVSRCLEKSREARCQSARDLAFALEGLSGGTASMTAEAVGSRSFGLRTLPLALTAALGATFAVVTMAWFSGAPAPPRIPTIVPGELDPDLSISDSITSAFGQSLAISPDGTIVAFLARPREGGSRLLHVRRLHQPRATTLPGTEDAGAPFFSPDGAWIGFFAEGKLKKVAVTGGVPQILTDAPDPRGGAWGADDTVLFSPGKTAGTRLLRVPASGAGKPEPLAPLGDGELIQVWPQILPDGKGVLYTGSSVPGAYNDANLMVLPVAGGAPKVVHRGGYYGRYLPSGLGRSGAAARLGHLVYIHDGTLFAAPFDLARLAVTGTAVPAQQGVTSNPITGGAQVAVSTTGTMLFRPSAETGSAIRLHWMDREGTMAPVAIRPASLLNLTFAPDGRLAMEIRDGPPNIFVYDGQGSELRRLTDDPVRATKPVWTADGRRIAFASARGDGSTLNLWWQRADGTGQVVRLTNSANLQLPGSWHASGRYLAFEENHAATLDDIMILAMDGDEASGWKPGATPSVFLNSAESEREPMFSTDGSWLAYVSGTAGRGDVYVRPFPGPGTAVQISTGGGSNPTWSRTRAEIAYGTSGQIAVVPYIVEGGSFRAGKTRLWPGGRYQTRGPNRMFALHPDGARLALAPAPKPAGDLVTYYLHFFEELWRIAPPIGR